MNLDQQQKFEELIYQIEKSPLEFIYWLNNNKTSELLNYIDLKGNNLIMYCIETESMKIHDACLNVISNNPELVFQENKENINILIYAAIKGRKYIIERLYELRFDFNKLNKYNDSVLTFAANYGQTDIVEFLLSINIDIDIQNNDGNTALIRASYNNHTQIIKLLINYKCNLDITNNYSFTAITWAAKKGFAEIFNILIDHGADFNIKNINNRTPLMLAAEYGHLEILTRLINLYRNYSIDMDIRDINGTTALMWASHNGHLHCVKILIKSGFDLNNVDYNGNTALLLAIYRNHVEIVKLLMNYQADINNKSKYGYNIIFWAAEQGLCDIVILLLQYGANINDKNEFGQDILKLSSGNPELIKAIHRYLVTANIPNSKLSRKLLILRKKLLKIEMNKLVAMITDLIELAVSKEEFKIQTYNYIKENIFDISTKSEYTENIINAINELYNSTKNNNEQKEVDDEKISFINLVSNAIGKFLNILSNITFGNFRNKIIQNAVKNIKIMVMIHGYKDITNNFVLATSVKGLENVNQNIFSSKVRIISDKGNRK